MVSDFHRHQIPIRSAACDRFRQISVSSNRVMQGQQLSFAIAMIISEQVRVMDIQAQKYEINQQQLEQISNSYTWNDVDTEATLPFDANSLYHFTPSPEKLQYYTRLRYLLQIQENSERSFALSSVILYFNSNNYYAMMLRKDSRTYSKKFDIGKQLHFMNSLLFVNSKQYQIWAYKKQLLMELLGKSASALSAQAILILRQEYQFIDCILLRQDTKNYHAWEYRRWLTKSYSVQFYEHQLKFTQQSLFGNTVFKIAENLPQGMHAKSIWEHCNSMWSYRYNLLKMHKSISTVAAQQVSKMYIDDQQQLSKLHQYILKNTSDQSAWNYLTGLYATEDIYPESTAKEQMLVKMMAQIDESLQDNKFALNFMLQMRQIRVSSDQNHQQIGRYRQTIERLMKIDPTRTVYYQYLLKESED